MEALVYFVLPVVLLVLGLPVFVVLLLTGMVGTIVLAARDLSVPDVLAVTIGTVAGALASLLVRGAGSS